MKILSSSWVVMLLGAVLYLATTAAVLLQNKSAFKAPPHAAVNGTNRPPANVRGPSWEFFNPDLEDMVKELKERKEALDAREKELNVYAARLKSEKEELSQVTRQVEEMRKSVDDSVVRIREDEQGNLKRLAKNYSQMDAAAAASVMNALDDLTLVKVLLFMKEAESAPILTQLAQRGGDAGAKRIALVSERLRLAQSVATKKP